MPHLNYMLELEDQFLLLKLSNTRGVVKKK